MIQAVVVGLFIGHGPYRALIEAVENGVWTGHQNRRVGGYDELRAAGHGTFFTVDAGPQVKAVCLPGAADAVAEALSAVPGVTGLLRAGLGGAPKIAESG